MLFHSAGCASHRTELVRQISGTMVGMNNKLQIPCTGFVLAGGKSSRMGANKAFVDFQGQTLLARALSTLSAVCECVTIVGDADTFSSFGPVVADLFPGCGPLGGIHAALANSSAELNLMLAVDMPFVTTRLLNFLLRMAEAADSLVTVPQTSRGFQPLCAIYRRKFVEVAEQALKGGNYKIDATFATVSVRIVEESELSAAGFFEKDFFNINTPEDCRAAQSLDCQA